jgi:cytochrome c5
LRSLFVRIVAIAAVFVACTSSRQAVDVAAASSPQAHADYEVFAQRCSKCHSLARPLNSGIDDDDYWRAYVAKMKRQPGSGISAEDTVAILRFLHVFSMEERRRNGKAVDVPAPDGGAP